MRDRNFPNQDDAAKRAMSHHMPVGMGNEDESDLRQQIEEILGDLWSRAFNNGSAHNPKDPTKDIAETAQAIEQLFTARLLAIKSELPEPYRSPNELDPKVPYDPVKNAVSIGEKSMLKQVTAIIDNLIEELK